MGSWTLDQVKDTLLWIGTFVGAITFIYNLVTKPIKKLSDAIAKNAEKIENIQQEIAIAKEERKAINEKYENTQKSMNEKYEVSMQNDKMAMRCLAMLVQHEATGNHINDMKKLYQEVRDYILK